jgi:hypothetical protein
MICVCWPDAFVQPKSWHRNSTTLKRIMDTTPSASIYWCISAQTHRYREIIRTHLTAIEQRNMAFTIEISNTTDAKDVEV